MFLLTEVVAEQEQGRQRVRRLLETVVSAEGETALVSIVSRTFRFTSVDVHIMRVCVCVRVCRGLFLRRFMCEQTESERDGQRL